MGQQGNAPRRDRGRAASNSPSIAFGPIMSEIGGVGKCLWREPTVALLNDQ